MIRIRTCVSPEGTFIYGIHKPKYGVTSMRQDTRISTLGHVAPGKAIDNSKNFPHSLVRVTDADWIYEIPNPFPFKGVTYIDKEWADASANNYQRICIEAPEPISFSQLIESENVPDSFIEKLPEPMLLALATCSTDPADLIKLAEMSCVIEKNNEGSPTGIGYKEDGDGNAKAIIHNYTLFEAVANNQHLPSGYQVAMVIRPGAQGGSEIVGEIPNSSSTHIYEYLRRNSYIGGGHYAANMAEDAIRYSIPDLTTADIQGLRHLYYQRTYIRLAEELNLDYPQQSRPLQSNELENLRSRIVERVYGRELSNSATLWGWNFGFDYSPSKYRLHASHQQIHQQYAMVPDRVEGYRGNLHNPDFTLPAYGCGDMIADVIQRYRAVYGRDFFVDYLAAIENNKRMDGRSDLTSSLVVWQDEHVILFVPKAQTSQWELQLMTLEDSTGYPPGNIIEANNNVRNSLDTGILVAQKALASIGAKMVTTIEYPKRIGQRGEIGQPLLYAFLPRLPESPGAFSEAQLRFINGHYPEDFAAVLRQNMRK